MKRILLADDYSIVRSGVKSLIKDIYTQAQINEAGNETEITQSLKFHFYDLVIFDIGMPGIDFSNMMNWIRISFPDTRLLVFSMYPEDIYGVRCLQMGARGYLRKTAPNDEIISAIRMVLEGKKYLSHHLTDLLLESQNEHKGKNPFTSLSPRELEIVKHLNVGRSLPEICKILNIQYSTANTYKRRIFEKLGVHAVHSLSQLIRSFDM